MRYSFFSSQRAKNASINKIHITVVSIKNASGERFPAYYKPSFPPNPQKNKPMSVTPTKI
jgi:hypothetical protein